MAQRIAFIVISLRWARPQATVTGRTQFSPVNCFTSRAHFRRNLSIYARRSGITGPKRRWAISADLGAPYNPRSPAATSPSGQVLNGGLLIGRRRVARYHLHHGQGRFGALFWFRGAWQPCREACLL
jgi:hypothetical protein